MSSESAVLTLIQGVQNIDDRLYSALMLLIQDFYALNNQINPPAALKQFSLTGQLATPGTIAGLTLTAFSNNIRLSWNAVDSAVAYEVRFHSGVNTDWDSASVILKTTTLLADINPLTIPLVTGTYTFLLKSIDSTGLYSSASSTVQLVVPTIAAPSLSVTVIGNNVLLNWTNASSLFEIAFYNIYKNDILMGNSLGTFEAIFETAGGVFKYAIQAVDIVGNLGTISLDTIVTVGNPTDFVLTDSRVSLLDSTVVNAVEVEDPILDYLLACINTTETWQDHFINHGYTTPQDQITAGFPIYIEPASLTGSYEEVVDYGVEIDNTILTVKYAQLLLIGTVTVAIKIATSLDGITYTAFTSGSSLFSTAMRYAKYHIDFTAIDTKSLIEIGSLTYLIDVKTEMDSGTINAVKTDVGGTQVFFNKAFKSINSITLTVAATEPVTAIYSFTSVPNPTSFFVYALDSTGNRTSYPISWKARGIV